MSSRLAPPATASDADRRDDSPSSIDTLKRAIAFSPIRRNKRDSHDNKDNGSGRPPGRRFRDRFLLSQDHRARLPPSISRFTGYRAPDSKPPYDPIPPFRFLKSIPLKYEVWATGWFGSLIGIMLVEAIMMTSTAFRDLYHAPIIIASFGATAVLVYGAMDSPLSQPRNVFGGHVISAIIGVGITRLFALDEGYIGYLENREFHVTPFINGAVCMATAILAMFITDTLHPPGGATALIAAIEPAATRLSWHYIPVIIASSLLMLGWALLINNLGRRRYPQYWWAPRRTFVRDPLAPGPREDEEIAMATERENPMRRAEDGGRTTEALRVEKMVGVGGDREDMDGAVQRAGRFERGQNTSSTD